LGVIRQGKNQTTVIPCAHILLKNDEDKTEHQIRELLYATEQTMHRVLPGNWHITPLDRVFVNITLQLDWVVGTL
jgi:hypothetical protein